MSDRESVAGKCLDNVDPPVKLFYRTALSGKLWAKLAVNQVVVLIGTYGSGKTQLSLIYADDFRKNCERNGSPSTVIWKIPASNEDEMLTSLQALADQLKLQRTPSGSTEDKATAIETIILSILKKLVMQKFEHLLIFDNMHDRFVKIMQNVFQKIESSDLSNKYKRIKIIITSNYTRCNGLVFQNIEHVPVNGISRKEIVAFFDHDKLGMDFQELEDDIVTLWWNVSFLPLALSTAKSYMIKTKTTPKSYLKLLSDPNTSDKLLEQEHFFECLEDYDRPLLKVLQSSLEDIKSTFQNVYFLFEIACFFNHEDIPLAVLAQLLPGLSEMYIDVSLDKLVEALEIMCLGQITQKDDLKYLTIHKITQLAVHHSLTDTKIEIAKKALLLLCSFVSIDIYAERQLDVNTGLIPHLAAALEHTQCLVEAKDSSSLTAAQMQILTLRVILLNILACTQTRIGFPEMSEKRLSEAKQLMLSLINKTDDAKLLYDQLSHISVNMSEDDIISTILNRKVSKKDQDTINDLLKQKGANLTVSEYITADDYDDLVQYEVTLPRHLLRKIFLPELFVSVLYSCGQLYFKHKSDPIKRESFLKDMHKAREIANLISKETESKYHTLYELLSHRNNILQLQTERIDEKLHYYKLKTDREYINDLAKAVSSYENIVNDQECYYQCGILKVTKNDQFNKLMIFHKLLKAWVLLHELDHTQQDIPITVVHDHYENMLKLTDGIMHDTLQRNPALLITIYNTIGDFEFLQNSDENFKKAKESYTKSKSLQDDADQTNYDSVHTLFGLAKVTEKFATNDPRLLIEAKNYIDSVIVLITKNWPDQTEDLDKAKVFKDSIVKNIDENCIGDFSGIPVLQTGDE